ncbi:hypothetical protein HYT02_02380 [Candidatus Gottesmanbacteria bacterium]|nr:hypothetical protein [Candidatus Gottesmanbacteria bacterium]
MSEQIDQFSGQNKTLRIIVPLVISIIATALIVGGGFYWWGKQKETKLNNQITNLQNEINQLRQSKTSMPTAVEWGPTQNQLRTKLVPLQQKYIVGQSMKFRLEMINTGNSIIMYDSQQAGVNNAMVIIEPDGKTSPYIAGSFQTLGGPKSIEPEEIVILFDQFDITPQYFIDKPGRYTVQFRGQDKAFGDVPIPESNILEIEAQPGNLNPSYLIVGRLLDILPEGWNLTLTTPIKIEVNPLGRQSAKGVYISLDGPGGGKARIVSVDIWQMDMVVDLSAQKTIQTSEYLGKNRWGHVYVFISPDAKTLWPRVREQITESLEIQ